MDKSKQEKKWEDHNLKSETAWNWCCDFNCQKCLHLTSQFCFTFFKALNIDAKKYFSTNNNIIAQDTVLFSCPASLTTLLHFLFFLVIEVWLLNNKIHYYINHFSTTKLKELCKYQKLMSTVDHNPSSQRQDKTPPYSSEFLVAYHRVLSMDGVTFSRYFLRLVLMHDVHLAGSNTFHHGLGSLF